MNIFENLEELNVSEACLNDILDAVEGIINEYLTVGNVLDATNKSIGTRKQQYLNAGKTPGTPPEDKKRLGDRFERAAKIKKALTSRGYKTTRRADSIVRDAIKKATQKSKEAENPEDLSYTWNVQHTRPGKESGYRVMPILKTDRF